MTGLYDDRVELDILGMTVRDDGALKINRRQRCAMDERDGRGEDSLGGIGVNSLTIMAPRERRTATVMR